VLSFVLSLACDSGSQPTLVPDPPAFPNVLLITIDTLRADRLGAWGYDLPTSPHLDALAAQSLVFLEARSPSSWTLPALASLMTSTHSSTHGIWRFDGRLAQAFDTLAERLAARGFRTAAVGNHTFLAEKFGLHQGFQEFDVSLVREQLESHIAVTSPEVTARGIAWLEANRMNVPWLLWLHYFDPHAVYQEHVGFSERFGTATDSQRYDGEIAFTDASIGDLLQVLTPLGFDDDTIVVLVADHGEEFQEHGGDGHGTSLHREVLHVPLLFRVPGMTPRRVDEPASLVDILPTILELLGLPASTDLAGRSLVASMRGSARGRPAVLGEVRLHSPWESLETRAWKLLRSPASGTIRLFDLLADPTEQHDVARGHPEVVLELEARLRDRVRAAETKGRRLSGARATELSPAELRRLKDLGYVED
jgi:arylsulfatase A-like enzyme